VFLGDLVIKLQNPEGRVLTILNRAGSNAPDDGTDQPFGDTSDLVADYPITFRDGATDSAENLGSTIGLVEVACQDDSICEYQPARDTATSSPTSFVNAFAGGPAAGVWTLFVADAGDGLVGTLVRWSLTIEHEQADSFTSNNSIAIPDDAYNGTLESMVSDTILANVTAGRVVTHVTVEVALDHTWVGDLTIKLRSPAGTVLTLLNRPGSTADDNGPDAPSGDSSNLNQQTPISFDDRYETEAEEMGFGLGDNGVVCATNALCHFNPSPDTAASAASFAAAFNGQLANGQWTLLVSDSAFDDTGSWDSWRLQIESASTLAACSTEPFTDVAVNHPFCAEIAWMEQAGISTGFNDGTYRPSQLVTRQAMSAFMARLAADIPSGCTEAPFSDVPVDHPFCAEIAWMKENGITTGFTSGCGSFAAPCYLPGNAVTRQAMSAFMARVALGAAGAAALPPCSEAAFTDVPADAPFCSAIAWMRDAGISTGFEDGTYKPAAVVTRQAMSAFMYRVSFYIPS
jgi:subtilisin-like proprotein convertase family protein